MKFQTTILLEKQSRNLIDYNSKILLLGSCFSENIGQKLDYFKLQNYQNPFGILFHPKAIEQFITDIINTKTFTKDDLIFQNERYHSFDAHSSLSEVDENMILNNLNSQIIATSKFLKNTSHLVITLGTAWVYRFIEDDKIVANCHKIPQKKFLKELLTITEISESLEAIISLVKNVNPDINLLFTVSPVRHLKDGFVENMQSKSHLISAVHEAIDKRNNIHYFPAYEIMMDELRDYRFYTEDMIHPNHTAIQYIWEKFTFTWFSENTKASLKEIDTIQKGIAHKPFNPKSKEHLKFLHNLSLKQELLTSKFPHISF
ncbi:GSCFA domain-containing protein [Polaribacter sp. MED152]|uniref:GSCFA domain-containing protein n=1 Tax=Polaribacter sp. MED152 TaxID=313598 RepID=UPI000068C6C0|nr:GSCFA domain-containing protein [Polaribacter sp. MED152]EAQ42561.1 GSCFA family protein [Polaribacter sp. MED152]